MSWSAEEEGVGGGGRDLGSGSGVGPTGVDEGALASEGDEETIGALAAVDGFGAFVAIAVSLVVVSMVLAVLVLMVDVVFVLGVFVMFVFVLVFIVVVCTFVA